MHDRQAKNRGPILLRSFLVVLGMVPAAASSDDTLGLRIAPGFTVTEFADATLANDIYRMTLDPGGRIVVAGRGYIRTLVDDDGDGRADRALEFADGPRDGAMGLLWEGDTLYVTGDGGLRRYRDRDGDGRADGPAELIRAMKTGGEHAAHAIRRGPDGWLYVICGNFTGIDGSFAQLPTSPIKEPVAGCVLRFSPDLGHSEIVADGFRNAYGMDFNPDGELFAFDSDNERCVSLPWYEPTRFYHVVDGGHHGWRAPQRGEFWRLPSYDPDVARPLVTLGRGSPTGVACYRHTQFPERYQGAFFLLDWTFGKVHVVPVVRAGSTYSATSEVFLESLGSSGFAPTDVVVHPGTGDLYVSIGGRGTRGGVYRVRHSGSDTKPAGPIAIKPRKLDWSSTLGDELLATLTGDDEPARLRALITLRRHRDRMPARYLRTGIVAGWVSRDRTTRRAAADLIAGLDAPARRGLAAAARSPEARVTLALGIASAEPAAALELARSLLADVAVGPGLRLDAVRVIQVALGDLTAPTDRGTVWEGYSTRAGRPWPGGAAGGEACLATLRAAYSSVNAELDRELSRTLAMLEDDDPKTLEKVNRQFVASSHPVDDLHHLIVLARLRAPRTTTTTAAAATALVALDRKLDQLVAHRERFWPLRVAELYAELARKDPALHEAVVSAPDFGRPDHALFALSPGFNRERAAEIFLARARADQGFAWTTDVVELLGSLPPDRSFPALRPLWGRAGLDDAILTVLARHPDPADRPKFLEGIASPQWSTVRLSIDAIERLPGAGDDEVLVALVRALGQIPDGKEGAPMRGRITRALARATGRESPPADRAAWTAWLAATRPDLATRLEAGRGGADLARWRDRAAQIDWSAGKAEPGREVFVKSACATCHSGAQALGPDLRGVTGRFSRDDLFTAIVQPSRDVSARYRTILVATRDGQVYQGTIIYEALDGLILQTSATSTVRIAGDQIESRRDGTDSLMPAGLLEKLSDREVADLYAYLKSLP
jgi:putative membrane-bound dehydrogenase-like protein